LREAKSYSIVDHQLLHGGYFSQISHSSLALYLFLITAADKHGRSYYSERSIVAKLKMSPDIFHASLRELISINLVEYQRPNFWIKNLTRRQNSQTLTVHHNNNHNRSNKLIQAGDVLKNLLTKK
jgi:hypothetical protein